MILGQQELFIQALEIHLNSNCTKKELEHNMTYKFSFRRRVTRDNDEKLPRQSPIVNIVTYLEYLK